MRSGHRLGSWVAVALGMTAMLTISCGSKVEFSFSTARLTEPAMGTEMGADFRSVNPTDIFTSDPPIIYLSVKLSSAQPDTEVESAWTYIRGELEGVENYVIDSRPSPVSTMAMLSSP